MGRNDWICLVRSSTQKKITARRYIEVSKGYVCQLHIHDDDMEGQTATACKERGCGRVAVDAGRKRICNHCRRESVRAATSVYLS